MHAIGDPDMYHLNRRATFLFFLLVLQMSS